MSSALTLIWPYLAFGGSAGAGFMFVRWLLDWLAGRFDKGRAALDAGTAKHIERLDGLIDRQDKKIDECERERAEMRSQIAELRGQIAELRAALNSRGEIRQKAALIVAADKLDTKITDMAKAK